MSASVITFLLWAILAIVIIVGLWWIMGMILLPVNGQEATTNNTPEPITPTPVPTPTPTSPNPNFQYLPQKAYVQPFAPESGVPANSQPLTAVPQTIPAPVSTSSSSSNIVDSVGGIAGIMGMLSAAGVYVKTHFLGNKTKEVMAAEVKTKEQISELARVSYENMPNKGNDIVDAPAVKLETLAEDKAEFAEKAAKA